MQATCFVAGKAAIKPSAAIRTPHSSFTTRSVVAYGLKENVARLPPTNDVVQVAIPSMNWSVKNVEGKKASVTIYTYLATAYGGKLNKAAAEKVRELHRAASQVQAAAAAVWGT